MAAILDLSYKMLHMTYFHQSSLGGASPVGFGKGIHSSECMSLVIRHVLNRVQMAWWDYR